MSLRMVIVSPSDGAECPHPRSGHRVVVDQGNLYALGGYNPDVVDANEEDALEIQKRIFVQMWRFNFFTRCWKELKMRGDFPLHLASHSASLHGDTLFTFGGSGIPFGIVSSRDVHKCRLNHNSDTVYWSRLEVTGDVPEKKYGHSQVLIGHNFYLIGGTTGYIYNTDVHCLNLDTSRWRCIFALDRDDPEEDNPKHPVGRYRHEVVVHNNRILMVGGGQARRVFSLEKIPCFNLETEEWEEIQTRPVSLSSENRLLGLKDIPPARRCHSCVKFRNHLYVFGGRNEEDVLGDMWSLNLDTLQWQCIISSDDSILRCFFHDADITDTGCMYIFGGVTNAEEEVRSNSVHKIWLVVPSLQELCWRIISDQLFVNSFQSSSLPSLLLHAGVPREFIQRITAL